MTKKKNLLMGLATATYLALGAVMAVQAAEIEMVPYVTGMNAPLAMV